MAESFKGGVKSTLFPIDKKIKEDQATSIFFAVLELVFPFRDALFETIGQRPVSYTHLTLPTILLV